MTDSDPRSDSGAQIDAEIRARILKLARSLSVFEIEKRSGMPDAKTIYRELKSAPEFGRAFKLARMEYWQGLREEIAEHIARAQQVDLTSIFVSLKKLRRMQGKE